RRAAARRTTPRRDRGRSKLARRGLLRRVEVLVREPAPETQRERLAAALHLELERPRARCELRHEREPREGPFELRPPGAHEPVALLEPRLRRERRRLDVADREPATRAQLHERPADRPVDLALERLEGVDPREALQLLEHER